MPLCTGIVRFTRLGAVSLFALNDGKRKSHTCTAQGSARQVKEMRCIVNV